LEYFQILVASLLSYPNVDFEAHSMADVSHPWIRLITAMVITGPPAILVLEFSNSFPIRAKGSLADRHCFYKLASFGQGYERYHVQKYDLQHYFHKVIIVAIIAAVDFSCFNPEVLFGPLWPESL